MAMKVTALILTIYYLGFTYGAPSKEKDLKEELQQICPPIKLTPRSDLIITMNMISELGIHVRPDQRLCFFGRLLNGLVLPRNRLLQIPILKGLLTWYSPCLLVNQGYFFINEGCFDEREQQFLATFMGLSINYTRKPMNSRKLL